MNIETLRIFCDVVQHQSFSRGAAANNVSQSAATQCVHRMEQHFGGPLIDRTKRPFVVTAEGQVCYEGFREVLEAYDVVEARVRSLRKEITGLVRVAAIYSVGLFDMGRTMRDFMRTYPKAKVRLEYLRPNKVSDAVLNSEVDLGIISYPTASPEITIVPLRSERMVLVCHPKHPLTQHETVTVEHLGDQDFVAFDRDLSIRKEVDRCLRQRSVSVRVIMEFDNIETIKQALEIDAGVSILPDPTVRREVKTGTLAAIPLIAPVLKRPVGIIHRQRKVLTPTAAKFMEMLLESQGAGSGAAMREAEVRVTFQPSGKTAHVLDGTRLVEAAAGAGIALDSPCGGEGTCGKCRVIVRTGTCDPGPQETELFTPAELERGYRLACQSTVYGPLTVEVPETSVLGSVHKILTEVETAPVAAADSPISKRHVRLDPPSRGNDEPDLARIQAAVGPIDVDLQLLRELPGRLRQQAFEGTLVLADGRLVDLEQGDTQSQCHAAAFDVGTTTLVGMLLDACSGKELAVASRLNPQTSFGDDVLSRIQHAAESPRGLGELHDTIVEAIDEMIGDLGEEAGVARDSIYELTFSGNTTMQQLLCRIDPRWLGEMPFVPATRDRVLAPAVKLGFRIHPHGRVYVMPVIGGFVGGDTVSGILATSLAESEGPTLLVDIGTNGEIVLMAGGSLLAASTAAGPAFEGARISNGMRGTTGAIEKVIVDGSLRTNVIGDVPPVGLCGSALIDLGAELLRHGIVAPQGRLNVPDELPKDILPDLRRRIVAHDGQASFLLADQTETSTGRPIVVTQRDVRELQLATGAIRAGIDILLKRAGIQSSDLESVLVAGGFGNFIRRSNAQRIGLLPQAIPRHKIRYQGNTSLAGARLVAVSARARAQAETLARRTEHVDLSADKGFHDAFAEAMIFPEA